MDSPVMADFVANLDRINTLAENSPGFVWRLQDEGGNATALRPLGDDILINLTVWQDVDSLRKYVYQSEHTAFMRRRREWFEHMSEAYMVLWWIPKGHVPNMTEAAERLDMLRRNGPTAAAFTFRQVFHAPDELSEETART